VNNQDSLFNKVSSLDKDIAGVTKDQDIQNRAILKMEHTIEKLHTLTESIHRLISIHDERITHNAKNFENHIVQSEIDRTEMSRDIKELNARLTNDTAALSSKMEAMEQRLSVKIDNLQARLEDNERSDREFKEVDDTSLDKLKNMIDKWRWVVVGLVFLLGLIGGEHNILTSILKFFAL
jgi:hypothetical protein